MDSAKVPMGRGAGEGIYGGDVGSAYAGLGKSVILEIGEEIRAILFAFFRCVDIFVADGGKPGIGCYLAHLLAEECGGDRRIAGEIYLRNRQARAVPDLKRDFCPLAGKAFLLDQGLRFGVPCCREFGLDS